MSEELKAAQARIACLEGEIAKRDARIVELDKKYGWALSELSAIKAQEPDCDRSACGDFSPGPCDNPDCSARRNRMVVAPVSEAKAQGVVMPERWNVPRPMWKDARQPYGNPLNHADIEAAEKFNLALDEVARLNAAPVQQVSVPDASTDFSQFLSAVMDAAGLVRHGRRSKELSEYLGSKCMEYRCFAAPAAPSHGEQVREIKRLREAFTKMRNVAAGYSNHCEDSASTRRYEREFTAADDLFLSIVPSAGSQEQG